MDEDETDEDNAKYCSCIHKHLAESTMSEDKFSSVSETLVMLNKADACEATTRVTDSLLAERIEEFQKLLEAARIGGLSVYEKNGQGKGTLHV